MCLLLLLILEAILFLVVTLAVVVSLGVVVLVGGGVELLLLGAVDDEVSGCHTWFLCQNQILIVCMTQDQLFHTYIQNCSQITKCHE
jgi:hypothetical protein